MLHPQFVAIGASCRKHHFSDSVSRIAVRHASERLFREQATSFDGMATFGANGATFRDAALVAAQ
jgi:hypothetical protein